MSSWAAFMAFVVLASLVACQRASAWGDAPISCHISGVSIGAIEGFEIDGRRRSVSFRHVPDVWRGSDLIEKNGRLALETNEIGVDSILVQERPRESSVRIIYTLNLPDGGLREFNELLGCQRISPP